MTHRQRLQWLKSRGYDAQDRGCEVPGLGLCVWLDGPSRVRPVSLWLAVRDGAAVIHGVNEPALTWLELVEWIEPTEQPGVKKPLEKQRNLFGDE
jgi:hypothetical protein